MSKDAAIARINSMQSERFFLSGLEQTISADLKRVRDRIEDLNKQISVEFNYAEKCEKSKATKKAACKKSKAKSFNRKRT